jgi:hypothetical protein
LGASDLPGRLQRCSRPGPGALVGELGFLAPDHARTRTLECVDKAVVLRISYDHMKQLYFQNPDHLGLAGAIIALVIVYVIT